MRPIRTAMAVLGVVVVAACDIPTSVPKVDQRWILPADTMSISVDQMLPSDVTVSDGSFALSVDPFTAGEALGTLCSVCTNGPAVSVPPFDATFTATQPLPLDVQAVTLASGSVQVSIHNGFSFDPIAGGGTLTITLSDSVAGTVIGQVLLDGSTDALPPGSTVQRTVALTPGAVGSTLLVTSEVNSVGGQRATFVNTADSLVVTATPSGLLASSATVDVSNRSVSISPMSLDVGGIDPSIVDHVLNGSIVLDVTNPFGVAFTGPLVIDYPGGQVTKQVSVPGGVSTSTTVEYSQDELRQFLGQDSVSVSGTATVAPNAGAVTVTPSDQVDLKAKIDLTLEIGG